jgi:hydroxysqualene dehydroxylase
VPRRPLANVALAGDWLSDLPATIEAAVASGVAAAGVRLRPSPRSAPALAPA